MRIGKLDAAALALLYICGLVHTAAAVYRKDHGSFACAVLTFCLLVALLEVHSLRRKLAEAKAFGVEAMNLCEKWSKLHTEAISAVDKAQARNERLLGQAVLN